MRKLLSAAVFAFLLSGVAALAQTPAPANNVLGDVIATDAGSKQIFVKTDAGAVVVITVTDATRMLKNPPGEKGLDKATPIQLSDISAGDRVLALGRPSADGKTLVGPRVVVVNTKAELAAKQEAERAEWRRRGIVGVVSAVNPETKEITIQTRTPEGPKPVVIPAGASVKLRRYAPDSIKFADAKPSTFEEVKVGDQLRAKGDRSEDGSRFNADEVVTGTFRTSVGTITSVDAAKNEFTIKQLQGDQPLTVVVRADTVLKQIPPDAMSMMGGGGFGGAGGRPGGAGGGQGQGTTQAGAGQGSGQGAGPGGGQGQGQGGGMRRGGGDFMQRMLDQLPAVTLADLKPGQMVVVSSTVGADPARVTAIQLVSNVEPIIAMMSRRPGGAGAGAGAGAAGVPGGLGAGGFNFGFGIGQP
ncbi:MAG TPA: hypothetical protein VFA21_00920 [Pyrinomonadaceae bacterium]|nr:hypothetical protein [Pyrinomonadaceae bacterium]